MTPVYIHSPAPSVHILHPVTLPPPVHPRSSGDPPLSRAPILSPAACRGVTVYTTRSPLRAGSAVLGGQGSCRSDALRVIPAHKSLWDF